MNDTTTTRGLIETLASQNHALAAIHAELARRCELILPDTQAAHEHKRLAAYHRAKGAQWEAEASITPADRGPGRPGAPLRALGALVAGEGDD
jgi:hypothetical protein